jgi:hypothetical protein
MNQEKKPIWATIVTIVMAAASIWWLLLAATYFFGAFWWWYAGFYGAWLYALLYGLMGFIGLGIAGGLQMRLKQAYTATFIIAIIFLVFSIPSVYYAYLEGTWYGIPTLILSAIVIILMLLPGVKEYFNKETPPPTV